MANGGIPPIQAPGGLARIQSVQKLPGALPAKTEKIEEGGTFGELLKNVLSTTNQLQMESAQASRDFVAGETRNIHEVMIQMEKAGLAFRLVTQVRNKAIEAYREIIRMQI